MKHLILTYILFVLGLGFILGLDLAEGSYEEPRIQNLPSAVSDEDYYGRHRPEPAKIELGRALFFDKILSGNQNISCATCHHPELASADGLALSLGEGAQGLGDDRKPGRTLETALHGRVPRNSPALFNLGAEEFVALFHDGRVEADSNGYYEGGFITPAKWKLPKGLESVLAAQAMFPVASPIEMAGQKGENPIADAASLNNVAGARGVWEQLADRLSAVPEYVAMFRAAYPEQVRSPEDIHFVMAANAIAAFEEDAFRSDDSPFDRYLRGERRSMSREAKEGMALFYGKAGCSDCHSGKFQTDHAFYAIAMPQIGPGKGDGYDASYWRSTGIRAFVEDFGRGRVTVREEDNYKFRTPSLRNVALTGPWGHSGAYTDLEEVVRHHLDPARALGLFECDEGDLVELGPVLEFGATGSSLKQSWLNQNRQRGFDQLDTWVQRSETLRGKIAAANELERRELSDEEIELLVAFLESLTDPKVRRLASLTPEEVPSGLPVHD